MADEEALSLKGNVLLQKSFVTPHAVPAFLRASAMRVVAGSMLLGAIFASIAALVATDAKDRISCALSATVCVVAFYHYIKLTKIREQEGSRVTLAKPGEKPSGQASELKWSWQELITDGVRYSDWCVTLPPLVVELHLMIDGHTHMFSVAWSCLFVVLMVALGAFTRLGTDELVPPAKGENATLARAIGFFTFLGSCVCLFFVLFNLLGGLEDDPSNGFVFAFSLPWIGYGATALLAIVWRQLDASGYPEALSVTKDLLFGVLDVWSKAVFAFWVASKALGYNTLFFGF
jgi:bacteriorhodopsin